MKSFRLDNQISMVTGGSRGIGLGIARALAQAGSDIVLVARGQDQLKQAKEDLSSAGCRVWTYAYDMNDVAGIGDFYDRVVKETGGIDVLVNNAGGTRRGPAQTLTAEDWNFVINLNMSSVFAMCQAFGKQRIDSGKKGKIVNIASLMSEIVREDNAAYAASKGGIRQLTKALAVEWAPYNIHVNAIGPGYIRTELTRPLWEDNTFEAWVNKRTPVGRWGAPEDLGNAAVFLATPASDYITGHILYVDGGFLNTMGPVF
jgi:gluconate 5-dehydrogenase